MARCSRLVLFENQWQVPRQPGAKNSTQLAHVLEQVPTSEGSAKAGRGTISAGSGQSIRRRARAGSAPAPRVLNAIVANLRVIFAVAVGFRAGRGHCAVALSAGCWWWLSAQANTSALAMAERNATALALR